MPTEGHQQVYGAQHPPNIKLIKELKSSTSTSTSASSASARVSGTSASSSMSSSQSNHQGGSNSTNFFKNFEKQTSDAWEFDEDDEDLEPDVDYSFPISIPESEEVIKKVIKNHQETTQNNNKAAQASPKKSALSFIRSGHQMPGRVMRQGEFSNSKSQDLSSKMMMSAAQQQQPSSSSSSSAVVDSKSGANSASSSKSSSATPAASSAFAALSLNESENKASVTTASAVPSRSVHQNPSFVNPYASAAAPPRDLDEDQSKLDKFSRILSQNPVNLDELQKASWKGIPRMYRPVCWKLLSDYLPLKQELQEKTIEQKRQSYWESVTEHYSSIYIDSHHEMLRQILNDIPRMNPLIPIFQKQVVQEIFQRVLYVWAVRHPGTGYVQGINDLLTPFFTVFLTEYTDKNVDIQKVDIENLPKDQLKQLEADSYWCMSKLLERIQENYVFSQPGIQKNVKSLEDLIKRIDINLYNHLRRNNVEFIQFAFRWMNNLLMREIPLNCTIRLWDTYHAEPFGFSDFHLYVCTAFLRRYSKEILAEKDFQGLMLLLQNLPTKTMKANDVTLLTAEAYKLQVMFANSPNHTAT